MWQIILAVCTGLSIIVVAVTHVVKTIHGLITVAKSPWSRVHTRLDSLEGIDNKILERLTEMEQKQNDNDQVTARLELLNMVYHEPSAVVTIIQDGIGQPFS